MSEGLLLPDKLKMRHIWGKQTDIQTGEQKQLKRLNNKQAVSKYFLAQFNGPSDEMSDVT